MWGRLENTRNTSFVIYSMSPTSGWVAVVVSEFAVTSVRLVWLPAGETCYQWWRCFIPNITHKVDRDESVWKVKLFDFLCYLMPIHSGWQPLKKNTSTKQTSLPQLQKTPTNGSTVFEWLSKSVNKSTLCMKMKMIVVTHAYCSTTHRFCTCRFSSHCAALCIDQARRTPTGLHGDHYWPCVLCTAASCSFCRAAETRTRPCSSRWSGQRSRAPVGAESGWDMCTAPGWHIREGGNTGVEFYSLFDLSLTWRTRESVCMLTNLEKSWLWWCYFWSYTASFHML